MKIICVDDERLALEYLTMQLRRLDDAEVIGTFGNSLEALDAILHQHVDLVMLDIQMPEMNGLELAAEIQKVKPDICIVFITAYSQFIEEALQVDAIDFIVKPITLSRLQQTMERVRPLLPESKEQRSRSKSLHINTFRLPLFEIEGIALQDPPWRTRKTQELFVYLLQHHGQLIPKSDLLHILWKKRNLRESSALLYTTVYNMRQALQPFQDYITLHNVEKAYYLELNNVEVVSVLWEEALQKLGHVNHATIEKYVEIMSLNQRPYFEKINNTWIQSERDRLEQLWHKAAENIACYYEGINKEEEVHYWRRSVLQRNTIK